MSKFTEQRRGQASIALLDQEIFVQAENFKAHRTPTASG